jgi:hypothetical protein
VLHGAVCDIVLQVVLMVNEYPFRLTPFHEVPISQELGLIRKIEGYAKAYWAPKGVNVVPYPNQDVLYQDMNGSFNNIF